MTLFFEVTSMLSPITLSLETQQIKQELREEIEEYGLDDEQIAAVLNAAADRLPTSSPHEHPSQIFYNGSAMAANLLRQWADELTHHKH
jgi:hypothetical protein